MSKTQRNALKQATQKRQQKFYYDDEKNMVPDTFSRYIYFLLK